MTVIKQQKLFGTPMLAIYTCYIELIGVLNLMIARSDEYDKKISLLFIKSLKLPFHHNAKAIVHFH